MSLGLAGRRLLVASSHCFVLQSWLAECFLSFLYYRRGLGLGPGAARGCPGLPGATEGLLVQRVFGWTQRNPVGTWKQQHSLGVLGAPSNPSIYSLHSPPPTAVFCIWARGWRVRGTVLGWHHQDNTKPSHFSEVPHWSGSSHSWTLGRRSQP